MPGTKVNKDCDTWPGLGKWGRDLGRGRGSNLPILGGKRAGEGSWSRTNDILIISELL